MSEIDFNKAFGLLHVIEKALGHPKLKFLADAAMAELEAMAPAPKPAKEPEPKAEPELPLKDRRI